MLKLIWVIATLTNQGVLLKEIREPANFATVELYEAFGTAMTPRMMDRVRGAINAAWDHQVVILHRCEIDGQPV